jgi:hypothetical protein
MNESTSTDPLPPPRPGLKRVWRIWVVASIAVVIALMIPSYFALKWVLSSARAPQAPGTRGPSVVVASFLADFQPQQPKQGWHYYWNDNGPTGNTNSYVELRWASKHYVAPDPIAPAGQYVQLSNRSSHPGRGPAQNIQDDNEHAVVIAFAVAEAGQYSIRNSFISRNDGGAGGSVHLQVFVNNREVVPDFYCRTQEKTSFDRELGKLAARDNIYVCIGPGESDYHDSFMIDFSIGRF